MPTNYQPRGTTQTTIIGGSLPLVGSSGLAKIAFPGLTSGDIALRQQQATYEVLSQRFVAKIEAIRNGKDITPQAQAVLLALAQENLMTVAAAQGYQATITPSFWVGAQPSIIDWFATLAAQQALATANGWI